MKGISIPYHLYSTVTLLILIFFNFFISHLFTSMRDIYFHELSLLYNTISRYQS